MACWPYRWIVVSHVCRRWRAAALQCPRLWRRISATLNVDWTAELLRRSGVVPLEVALDISFPLGRGDRGKSCELILTQLPRIRTLRLSASKPLSARIIQLLSGTAPMLKNLSISLPWTIDLARPEDDESAPFAALIRRERAPRLVSLNIYEVGMHIQGSCSATLKHIFIQLTADSVIRPYAPVFLDALRAMPSLETITFKRCLLSQRQHILPPHSHLRAVELPRLKSINLTTDALECIMLLNEMALPRLTHLAVLSANTCRHGTELALTLAEKICTIGYLSTLYISRYPQFVRVGSGPRTTVNILSRRRACNH
ncbi:uncharacterized protein B0H18DRAFT_1118882 [Fomitopsis serialis]|uniref:uncharacterized protein n=1 Tax=Fomitopsis serialis TaxID=139415 RepID=UPI00200898E5|nr:uncharacterized protein B0H18DRAFT_1118882 [Neoantrodia serialis]KAH9926378.1 hypothetical protein B0H18DRAFT_1118882 [Neoantrodia serialis]